MITKESTTQLSIEELKKRWEMLRITGEVKTFRITEIFPKMGRREFYVENLIMELEHEFAICYDNENILLNNNSAISMFLKTQLTSIQIIPFIKETLIFGEYGIVYIEEFV